MYILGGISMDERFKNVLNEVKPEILENEDVDLVEEGILDSLVIMMLVSQLESVYSFYIDPEDIVPENFENVNKIWELVEKYQNNK